MDTASVKYLVWAVFLGASVAAWDGASFCDDVQFATEWSDDFEGSSLDTNKWAPVCSDSTAGADCLAPFPTHSSSNGAECRSATCLASLVSVGGGVLTMTSQRDPSNASAWLTGAVKTAGKAAWSTDDGTYRVCISAKLPGGGPLGSGQGIWPAHWMMPADDPCDPDEGEMDIMEMVDGSGISEATYHWQNTWPNTTCAYPDGHEEVWGEYSLGGGWGDEFHEFAVERSSTAIVFAVDGVVIVNSSAYAPPSRSHRLNAAAVPDAAAVSGTGAFLDAADLPAPAPTRAPPAPVDDIKLWPIPFYLILNTAVGGGWPGEPDEGTESPTTHKVDYVHVVRAI